MSFDFGSAVGDWWADSSSDVVGSTVDSPSAWDGVWDWASSSQGVSVLGGALKGGLTMYSEGKRNDIIEDASIRNTQSERDRSARIDQHNISVNKPLDMNLRKFIKP